MNDFATEMDENKLPSVINTLSILTFIGSGLSVLSGVWTYMKSGSNLAKMEEMVNRPDFEKMPAFAKKMYSPEALDLYRKLDVNKLPLAVITILSCALCIYGAMEMRKLKKTGYYTYCIGEILPLVGSLLFVGMSLFSMGWTAWFSVAIPAVFIVLYGVQLKYMTKE